jgi:thymidine kinase
MESIAKPTRRAPRLVVYTGPMFAGKTKSLIRLAMAYRPSEVVAYAPARADRHKNERIKAHSGESIDSFGVTVRSEFDPSVIGKLYVFDEYSLFEQDQYKNVQFLMNRNENVGATILIAGLDRDSFDNPFESMARVMCLATSIKKLDGSCCMCSEASTMSYRKSTNTERVLVGGADDYAPMCRYCYLDSMGA